MPELAYLNGVFCAIGEAKVSIEDRGFQFGDGIYEVVVAYEGRIFELAPHMERLRRSAAAIELDYDFDAHPLEPMLLEGLKRCGFVDAMIYVQMTRGVASRTHAVPPGITPTVVMTFKPLPAVAEDLRRRGARVVTMPDTRWSNSFVKAITLLPNVLARTQALRRGYDDVIFVSSTGEVRECTSANVFIVRNGALKFPPRTESVLHGITQRYLLACAESADIAVHEEPFDVQALRSADEVFMSSTAVEILAVTSIDDRPVGSGQIGPVTAKMHEAFVAQARGRTVRR